MKIECKILDDRLRLPEYAPAYATRRSAATDLRACSVHDPLHGVTRMGDANGAVCAAYTLGPGERVKFGAGFAIHLDSLADDFGQPVLREEDGIGFAGFILPRSGIGSQRGIVLSNLVGLIDPDYQGEIGLTVWNTGPDPFVVEPMMRLAQMVIVPTLQVAFDPVEAFSTSTDRGANGFGHTGAM